MCWPPVDRLVHVRIATGMRIFEVLLRPSCDLTLDIASRTTVIGEADCGVVYGVEPCNARVHRIEISRSFRAIDARYRGVPDNPLST